MADTISAPAPAPAPEAPKAEAPKAKAKAKAKAKDAAVNDIALAFLYSLGLAFDPSARKDARDKATLDNKATVGRLVKAFLEPETVKAVAALQIAVAKAGCNVNMRFTKDGKPVRAIDGTDLVM